ncbi:T9SS type A sorting domain-containing protein [bacterium]|nr:T9SS type A sorting domain-containing protein [bacterium]
MDCTSMRIRRTVGTAILGVLSIAILQNRAGAQWTCDTAAFNDNTSPWVSSLPCVMTIEESLSETDSLRFVRAAHEVLVEASSVEKIIRPRTKLEVFPPDLNISVLSPDSVHGQYDLVEISIEFPERLDTLFRNHFMNSYITEWTESWGNEALDFSYCDTCLLNPFDPDIADVWLISERWDDSLEVWVDAKRTNAFYYVQFDRNHNVTSNYMAHDSLGYFDWTPLPNQPEFLHQNREFRGRLAYRDSGTYRITARAWAEGYHQSEPVIVQIVDNESPGYVRVDPDNPTFLSFDNGELHYPCGPNIQVNDRRSKTPLVGSLQEVQLDFVYNNECQVVDTLIDSLAWCKLNHTQWGTSEWGPIPLHQAYFLALHDEMDKIAAAGVKTCRTMPQPWSYEWEYENLGDYSPSMHRSFELDQLIEKASEVGIVIQWDLFAQTAITHRSYGNRFWSWGKVDQDPDTIPERSYCYHDELGLNDPIEFIQDPNSKAWFKKRLRYFYARYGWSPNIGVIELRSESSGIEWMDAEGTIRHPYYDDDDPDLKSEYIGHVEDWHQEMASFIRESLDENNHPLALSYLTEGMDSSDISYEYVDVYCQSCYTRNYQSTSKTSISLFEFIQDAKPSYCSEIGLGVSVRSEIGLKFVQLRQSIISGSGSTGPGFDWYSTAGTEESLLATQNNLTQFANFVSEFTANQTSFSHPTLETTFTTETGQHLHNSADSTLDFSGSNLVLFDFESVNDTATLRYGVVFNPSFDFEDWWALNPNSVTNQSICELGNSAQEIIDSISHSNMPIKPNESILWLIGDENSILFDPIQGEQFSADEIADSTILEIYGDTTKYLLFGIATSYLKSQNSDSNPENIVYILADTGLKINSKDSIRTNDIVLYPNPSESFVCLKPFKSSQWLIYQIYDSHGQQALRGKTQHECIDVSQLNAGSYLLILNESEAHNFIIK